MPAGYAETLTAREGRSGIDPWAGAGGPIGRAQMA